jgi:hypothetical protein
MIFESRYSGRSGMVSGLREGHLGFATNGLREATFFEGTLAQPLLFREAMAALYHVVVSDYKYRPRDRSEFQAWLAKQDEQFLLSLAAKGSQTRQELERLEGRLAELNDARSLRLAPFHRARRSYFDYIYQNQFELSLLLDPVITVHPDEISFEAFSRDESSYARLAAKRDIFSDVGAYTCGTTNIDFSLRLHDEMEHLRTYRQTRFTVDPGGFIVGSDGAEAVREKKIDLPESWLDGFLQVHATMSLSLTHVQIEPVDLYNICRTLRRRKARKSPRALRWELVPGEAGRVVLEPWEAEIPITSSAVFAGPKPQSIRTWGRDRLQVLKRLLPVCRRVDVYLAGFGLPSFYVLDLGPIIFTLALSGWTDNDWTGDTNFELLTRRLAVTPEELVAAYDALRETRFATEQELSQRTGLGIEKCRSAVSYLCQAGRAMVDLGSKTSLGGTVQRHRDLLFSPFNVKEAASAMRRAVEDRNPRAKAARLICEAGNARFTARRPVSSGYKLSGSVRGTDNRRVRPLLSVDHQGQILEASCTCPHFKNVKLTKGPCEHILALRLAHMQRLEQEDNVT